MRVSAELDPRTVWAVTETAERLGITNSELLEQRLAGLRRLSIPERVRDLHARGFCDADMADELGYMVGQIGVIRRGLGLAPNKRYQATTQRTKEEQ